MTGVVSDRLTIIEPLATLRTFRSPVVPHPLIRVEVSLQQQLSEGITSFCRGIGGTVPLLVPTLQ